MATIDGATATQASMAKAANLTVDDARLLSGAELEQRILEVNAEVTAGAGGDTALLLQQAGTLALDFDPDADDGDEGPIE